MRHFFFTFFILFAIPLHADLRQALRDFEKAYEFHLKAQGESDKKRRSVTLSIAKNLYAKAATEFMALRQKGATLPLAYLEYMRDKKLATCEGDIRFEDTALRTIETTRRVEVPLAQKLDKTHPVPTIPAALIEESVDALTTSRFAARIRTLKGEAKEAEIHKLYEHFIRSYSLNLRAFYHLYHFVQDADLRWLNARSLELDFQKLLALKGANDLRINQYIGLYIHAYKQKIKANLACFMDPDFNLFTSEISCHREADLHNVIQVYKTTDASTIGNYHLKRGALSFNQNPEEAMSEFMTAFQNGATTVALPISVANTRCPLVSPPIFLAMTPCLDLQTQSYFAYMGMVLHKLDMCKIIFTEMCQPQCSAFGAQPDVKDLKTAESCFSAYMCESNKFSDKAVALLEKAAELGHVKAKFAVSKRLIYGHDDMKMKQQGVERLKRLIKKHRHNKQEQYAVVKAMAMLASLHLIYEIGTPHQSFDYAKRAIKNRKLVEGDPPSYSLLAYYYFRGIGCTKNLDEARRLQALDRAEAAKQEKPEPLWSVMIDTEINMPNMTVSKPSYMIQLALDQGTDNRYKILSEAFEEQWSFFTRLYDKFATGMHIYEITPDIDFMFKRFFAFLEKDIYEDDDIPFVHFAILKFIVELSRNERYHSLRLYVAKALIEQPALRRLIVPRILDEREKDPQIMLESAVSVGHREALIFKAECLLKKQGSYGEGDRKAALHEALKIYNTHQRRYNLDDMINRRLIENELSELENAAKNQKKQDIPEDDIVVDDEEDLLDDGDSDDESDEVETGGAASALPYPGQPHLSDDADNDDDLPLTADEREALEAQLACNSLIKKAKQRSAEKKRALKFQHRMQLPQGSSTQLSESAEPQIFTVSAPTAEFIDMVYGLGETRIHHYDVHAAETVFNDLGLVKSPEFMHWEYNDAEGIMHKLSFHSPHGRSENKLYLAIRQRIKHFFMRIGVTPESLKIK